MPHDYPKSEFEKQYRNVVRPIAVKCSTDFDVIKRAEDRGSLLSEEETILKKYHDVTTIWYVGLFLRDLDTAMIHGQGLNMLNALNQVHGVLKEGSTYWKNVWKNDLSSDEAKNLKELGKAVEVLVTKL